MSAIAKAVAAFRQRHDVFVVMAATERLDARPARKISERLGGVPMLTSEDYTMYRDGQRLARLPHDGLVALPRHRDLNAGAGSVGRHHHGRAYPQPDARART